MIHPPDIYIHARHALYELLARLVLRPPDAALLATLRDLPGLAELVAAGDGDLEALQVEYERVFGRNVYPYESLYRDRELMLNTAAAERVAALYIACDFATTEDGAGAADHLGLELRLMSHLLATEAQAIAAGDLGARGRALALQARCLHEHLACWAPVCGRAVLRVAALPLFRTLAGLVTELILSDCARYMPPAPAAIRLEPQGAHSAGGAGQQGELRGNQGWDSLADVVRRLLTPDDVGVFLSRADISALGRRLELPVPIGERFQMLRSLFEAAGQFEQAPALLDALDGLLAGEQAAIAALAGAHPAWGPHAAHWRARLGRGRALLAELRAQAGLPGHVQPES
jgi:TorA maturation chaperone TorD